MVHNVASDQWYNAEDHLFTTRSLSEKLLQYENEMSRMRRSVPRQIMEYVGETRIRKLFDVRN